MNSKLFFFGIGVGAVVWLLLTGALASGQTPPPAQGDEMILSGFLSCSSGKDASGECPYAMHYVTLTQGRAYAIRVESSAFDARLTLEDQSGNVMAQEAGSLDDLNGCIVFRPTETGSYRLIASARPPLNEGFYLISVRAIPVLMQIDGALTASDPLQGDCHHQVHEVALTAGQRYVIDLQSDNFAAFVKLLDSQGAIVAFNDECTATGTSRIVFTAPVTGTYRVVATSFAPGATGLFTLTVCEP